MVFEYNFNPYVDRFRSKWDKICKNCNSRKATKIVVLSIYDIRPLGYLVKEDNGKGPLARKKETFIEYLLCNDCLADIKHKGAFIDALGGK